MGTETNLCPWQVPGGSRAGTPQARSLCITCCRFPKCREGDSKLRLQTPEPQTSYAARCSFWPEIPTLALHQPRASYAFSTRAPGDLSSGQPTQPRSNPAEQEGWRPQLFPSSHTPSQNLCPYRPWEPGRGQHTAEETRSAPPASMKARLFNLHETGWWGHGDLLDS